MTETSVPITLKGDALWGGKAIALFMDCSVDTVTSARAAGAPIAKVGGQLFALRSELLPWLKSRKPQAA